MSKNWYILTAAQEAQVTLKHYEKRLGLAVFTTQKEEELIHIGVSVLDEDDYLWAESGIPLTTIGFAKGRGFKCKIVYK